MSAFFIFPAILGGGETCGFAEALDEVVDRVEGKLLGNPADAEVGGLQERFGVLDLGIADIAAHGLAGLLLELFGEVIL